MALQGYVESAFRARFAEIFEKYNWTKSQTFRLLGLDLGRLFRRGPEPKARPVIPLSYDPIDRYVAKSGDELFIPRSRDNKTWDVKDFGVNVGEPIVQDRLWFWDPYGGSRIDMMVSPNPISPVPDFLEDIYNPKRVAAHDKTQLNNVAAKLNAQFGRHSLEDFSWDDKTKQGQGLGPTRPPETT